MAGTLPDLDTFAGHPEWHAVVTIQLGQLIESGVFDWGRDELDWKSAAYDDAQYSRVCEYFNARFYWREISILPVRQWFDYLRRKLVYELMPKYRPLYEAIGDANPLAAKDEYFKERVIQSDYPETQLSGNSDYASFGTDKENQHVTLENPAVQIGLYAEGFKGVDELLLDDLDSMFVGLYSLNINAI